MILLRRPCVFWKFRLSLCEETEYGDMLWLTDKDVERLRPCFSVSHGQRRINDRLVLIVIVFVYRHGLSGHDAPRGYGPHNTLYDHRKCCGDMGNFHTDNGWPVYCEDRPSDHHDCCNFSQSTPHGLHSPVKKGIKSW